MYGRPNVLPDYGVCLEFCLRVHTHTCQMLRIGGTPRFFGHMLKVLSRDKALKSGIVTLFSV